MFCKNLLTLSFLIAVKLSHAQQADTLKRIELDPVVVSATRSAQNPLEAARSVTVMSKETIENSGAGNLADLLALQEGMYIVGAGQNPGQLQNLFMRGANNNQTVIWVDGIRLSDPSTPNNAPDLAEWSLANIERIEMVRGSHSTLYGGSAIGGVVHIITKKNQTPGFHVDAGLRAGAFGEGTAQFIENLALNYTHKDGLYFNAELFNTSVNGQDATIDTVTSPTDYIHNHREQDGFRKTDWIGKGGFKNERWDVYASYKSVDQETDIDDGAYHDDDNHVVNFRRDLFSYGAGFKLNDKVILSFSGGLTDLQRKVVDDSTVVADGGVTDQAHFKGTYEGTASSHEWVANFDFRCLQIVAGLGVYNETMTARTRYFSTAFGIFELETNLDPLHIKTNTLSEFLHMDVGGELLLKGLTRLNLGLGLRNTHHSLFGTHLTYEINPGYKVSDQGLLYASFTTGYNAPSLYQLFSPDVDFSSGISRGNKNLVPESSRSIELGFKQKIRQTLIQVSFFTTRVRNSIDYVYLWNAGQSIASLGFADYRGDTYLNIGEVNTYGAEIALKSNFSKKFLVFGHLSLVNGRLRYDPSSADNIHSQGNHIQLYDGGAFLEKTVKSTGLVRRPHTAALGSTYRPLQNLSFTGNLQYAGARKDIYYNFASGPFGALATRRVSPYSLIHLLVDYSPVKNLSLQLKIENLFDTDFQEIEGYTTRGRGMYWGARYRF